MRKHILSLLLIIPFCWSVNAQDDAENQALKNASDSISYSFGILIGNNMMVQGVNDVNFDKFIQGFKNGFANEQVLLKYEEANQIIQDYFNSIISNEATMNLAKSVAFLEENKTQEGVVTLPSGLQFKELKAGEGESPKASDQVRVHYHGTFIDGKVFDSSIERDEPIVFGVSQVIPGWTEALQLMKPGARWMLFIPSNLAYGEQGAGGVIGPNQALIFEVELIEVIPQ